MLLELRYVIVQVKQTVYKDQNNSIELIINLHLVLLNKRPIAIDLNIIVHYGKSHPVLIERLEV